MKTKNVKSKEEHEVSVKECLRCSEVPCVDFHYSRGKLEGGELYVLMGMIEAKLHMPCEVGYLIYSICKLSDPLTKLLSYPLFIQCIRDLRTSAFLLLCSHYRSSMQILRPVIENYLTGLYFDGRFILAQNEKEKQEVKRDFENFRVGKYEIPEKEWYELYPHTKRRKRLLDQDFLLKWILSKKMITRRGKDKISKLIGLLNRYIHPHFPFAETAKASCPDCPACVNYDEEEYKQCIELFQEVMTDLWSLLHTFIKTFFPEKLHSEEVKEAVEGLKAIGGIEEEIKMPVVHSKELKELISTLPEPQ